MVSNFGSGYETTPHPPSPPYAPVMFLVQHCAEKTPVSFETIASMSKLNVAARCLYTHTRLHSICIRTHPRTHIHTNDWQYLDWGGGGGGGGGEFPLDHI